MRGAFARESDLIRKKAMAQKKPPAASSGRQTKGVTETGNQTVAEHKSSRVHVFICVTFSSRVAQGFWDVAKFVLLVFT